MFLKTLKLTNFRNFAASEVSFDSKTLFIGKNAQGKSNLLEAIYFLATTKSYKAEKDVQLIKDGQEYCLVEGKVREESLGVSHESLVKQANDQRQKTNDSTDLEIGMQLVEGQLGKRVKVNGVAKKVIDYIGNLVVILFSPEDINLVAGPPALRRWHIDLTLAQIDREYKRAISEYSEVLTSRNRVLKRIREGLARIDELEFWTGRLLATGLIIFDKRARFFEFLQTAEKSLGDFDFLYLPNPLSPERLNEYLGREIASGNCLIGPHRDDFIFVLKGQNLAFFGSRGEQRSSVLDLKLLELEYVSVVKKTKPVLLLDDIFSELDVEHKNHVVRLAQNQQTIITAIEGENIPEKLLKETQIIKVNKGSLVF